MTEACGTPPVVSVVVVTYRRRHLLRRCLESLCSALPSDISHELIVVDNGSDDGTTEEVRAMLPKATVLSLPTNVGFTRAVMHGIRRARGEWIALFNDDVTLDPAALTSLLAAGRCYADVGSLAAQMRFAARPGTINSAGLEVDRLGIATDRLVGAPADASEANETVVFGVSGGAALYRHRMLDELNGFDETFFAYLEDADLAWRARMRGWRSLYVPQAVVYHHHSATLVHRSREKYFLVGRNRIRLLAKNASRRQLLRYWPAILLYASVTWPSSP